MVSKKANNNTKCTTRCKIAQKVRSCRLKRGYTQKDLANKFVGAIFKK